MRYNTRSRLHKRLENKSRKNFLFNLIGIVFIAVLLFKFGIPILINFTLFVSGQTGSKADTIQKNNVSFVAPPVLNPLPIATNSAEIVVSGTASKNQTISLYVNNIMTDQAKTQDNGNFSFNLTLTEQENIVKARSIVKDKESDFSQSLNISYKDSAPALNIEHPADEQSFSKEETSIEVKGQTDPLVKVSVNGFRAIIDQYNNFSYNFPLNEGENVIVVTALDEAGNKTEKEIKVIYHP